MLLGIQDLYNGSRDPSNTAQILENGLAGENTTHDKTLTSVKLCSEHDLQNGRPQHKLYIHFYAFCVFFVLLWIVRGLYNLNAGKYFIISFGLGLGNFIAMCLYLIFNSMLTPDRNRLFSCIKKFEIPISNVVTAIENMFHLINTLMIGFHLIGMSDAGKCSTTNFNYGIMPTCNPAASINSIPMEQVIFLYISQILVPLLFARITRLCILLSSSMTIAFILISYWFAEGSLIAQLWAVIEGVIVCYISYMFNKERSNSHGLENYPKSKILPVCIIEEAEKETNNIKKKMNNALVHQMLPQKVADKILSGEPVPPEQFDDVTVFFSDVKGFTYICANVPPLAVVNMLNDLYTVMDYCCSLFHLYKVETIGDAYMVVGGLPRRTDHHAQHVADFALLVQAAVGMVKSPLDGSPLVIRMGIHSGPVLAGVVGNLMPRYCLFGDTVNTASRMESNGEEGRIHCSEQVAKLLKLSNCYEITKRGDIDVKGKGIMTTYWLESAKASYDPSNSAAIYKVKRNVADLLGIVSSPSLGSPSRDKTESRQGFFTESEYLGSELTMDSSLQTTEDSGYLRILVVEDSALQRRMLHKLLKGCNSSWDIAFANTGEHALDKLKAARFMFQVVIVDENLSECKEELYGHELVKIMRKSLHMESCVIIACLSDPNKYRQSFVQAGADDVWTKPPARSSFLKMTDLVKLKANKQLQ